MKITIHTAVISHRFGTNEYAASSLDDLNRHLAEYCRSEWESEIPDEEPPDETADDRTWINAYFDHCGHEALESIGEVEIEIPTPFTPRTTATILAALRHWQRTGNDLNLHGHFDDHTPLTNEEINTLCESLNCGDPQSSINNPQSSISSWTPVTTRLPDADTSVIVATEDGGLGEGFLDDDTWRWAGADRIDSPVTHWKEFGDLPD